MLANSLKRRVLLFLSLVILSCTEPIGRVELRELSNKELEHHFRYRSFPQFNHPSFYDHNGQHLPAEEGYRLLECMNCVFRYFVDDSNAVVRIMVDTSRDGSKVLFERNQAFLDGPNVEPIAVSCEDLTSFLNELFRIDQGNRNMDEYDFMVDMTNMSKVSYIIEFCSHDRFSEGDVTIMHLIIQHAPYRYRKKYEPFLMKAVSRGLLSKSALALTIDRNLLDEGSEQLYGTQYKYNRKGEKEIYSLHCPEELDHRRLSFGLNPLYLENN